MLHRDSFVISQETFGLIQSIQAIPEFENFHLVGGTALALQIGHRNSIDIDLLTRSEFKNSFVQEVLTDNGLSFLSRFNFRNALIGEIDGVKVDFIRHNYEYINAPILEEQITLLSKEDIAAMKLNAISDSGKRLKDFIDIYYLLEFFSLDQILKFYKTKYPLSSELIALKSINYFDNLDLKIDPPKPKKEIELEEIKNRINEAVLNSRKVFN